MGGISDAVRARPLRSQFETLKTALLGDKLENKVFREPRRVAPDCIIFEIADCDI
jgi:hypothetical protein